MTERQKVVVIGAGIVGVSTALWCQRMGADVTLVDRDGPAAGASQGNGGVLASIAVVPVTVPGLLRKAPRMLFDPEQPLFLRWRYLPRLAPFLRRYLAHGRADRVARISQGLHAMLHDSALQHAALAEGTEAARFVAPGSYLFGYADRAAFEADAFAWETRARRGMEYETLSGTELAEFDPSLEGRFGFGVRCRDHGTITDPGAYVRALAAAFKAAGGEIVQANLVGFEASAGRALHAQTDTGPLEADRFVMATGAWSGPVARQLGVDVPLESERGYHVEFHDPSINLRAPIMVASGKFVVTPMEGRLRAAGVIEFGGLSAGPSEAPFALLKRNMAKLFPDLSYSHTTEWMGHRPATADSLPVIGAAPKLANVFLGYGHHHIGLTGGPKTGRWLAQMVTGIATNEDLSAFSPARKLDI
ncbi:NAD(P)/FAD-dependent oxidoreductase [Roseobacteraceae bacterium S113]